MRRRAVLTVLALCALCVAACASTPAATPPGPVPPLAAPPADTIVAVPPGYWPVWIRNGCTAREVSFTNLKVDGVVRPGETHGFLVRCPETERRY